MDQIHDHACDSPVAQAIGLKSYLTHSVIREVQDAFTRPSCMDRLRGCLFLPNEVLSAKLMQMTGLDRQHDQIMSICCFITDADLNLVDEGGFEIIVHHDQATLDRMGEWCTATHSKSGLTKACLESTTKPEDAASGLLAYIQKYVPDRRHGLLAGNSVHCDKEFLSQPPYGQVINHLHYRILDVSSIKEAARRWADEKVLKQAPAKQGLHQAREDVLESIAEARYYREVFFVPKNAPSDQI